MQPRAVLDTPADRDRSPYTGYTRRHWLEITEKLIAGFLPFFDPETGMPRLVGRALPREVGGDPAQRTRVPQSLRRLRRLPPRGPGTGGGQDEAELSHGPVRRLCLALRARHPLAEDSGRCRLRLEVAGAP